MSELQTAPMVDNNLFRNLFGPFWIPELLQMNRFVERYLEAELRATAVERNICNKANYGSTESMDSLLEFWGEKRNFDRSQPARQICETTMLSVGGKYELTPYMASLSYHVIMAWSATD